MRSTFRYRHLAVTLAAGLAIFFGAISAQAAKQKQNRSHHHHNKTKHPAAANQPQPDVTDGTLKIHHWALVDALSDSFDGKTIDTKKWNTDLRSWGRTWSWSAKDVSLSDGTLHLALKYQPHPRKNRTVYYTAGIIRAQSPVLYGYFEAKIKAPALNPGAKAAFWLGGHGILHDPFMWTEIDILETNLHARQAGHFSIPHNVHVFIHPNAAKSSAKPGWSMSVGPAKVNWDPAAAYHVYGCLWTPKVIKMYVDGKLQGTITNRWWHQPLYLMLQNTVQWPYRKKPSPKGFPNSTSVDYVRVWKFPDEVEAPAMPKGIIPNKKQWKEGLDYQPGS